MTWAIKQKIQDERTQHDPMDCSRVPWNSATSPDWGTLEDWKSAPEATWGPSNQGATNESPTDIDYANSKGKGKGEGYSGGKGYGKEQNPVQYHMMMAMKAMKGGGKSSLYSGNKGAGKGKGKSDDRECYNCGGKGHIARNCPHPKNSGNSRVPAREVGNDEGEELVWGALVIDEVQDIDSAEDEKRKRSELEAKKLAQRGNLRTTPDPKATAERALKDDPGERKSREATG